MVLLEDLKQQADSLEKQVNEIEDVLDIKNTREEYNKIQETVSAPGFWDNTDGTEKILSKQKKLEKKLNDFKKFKSHLEDVQALIELSIEAEDESTVDEIKAELEQFQKEIDNKQLETLLNGEYDAMNAILTFHAGAGGTEAQDWTSMLIRMYTMWGEKHGYKVTVLDQLDGDDAGIKSCTLEIEGDHAYGYLKSENGVHRLVRVSPFDASGRRHTSFAALEVMPEIDDTVEVDIRPEDLKIDAFRASGAGGQHINKTSSAIRITHIPTGIVVSCQTQRSQHQNRDYAMKMLKSQLVQIKEQEHLDKIEDIKGVQKKIEWGAQIRSYVFMPYTLVKDHRTNFENGNVNAVMDGDLDGFIHAYLKDLSHGTLNTK